MIADGLESLLLPPSSSVKAQYAARYRLAFSLLNEDSSVGDFAYDWDIDRAIHSELFDHKIMDNTQPQHLKEYLSPTMNELSVLHNFTIESQVQYHAPLAYELPSVNSSEKQMEYELGPDQLKTFVNSAEWTLGVITSATQWPLS